MEGAGASRYWCHMCSQNVNPVVEIESVKCPICRSGFVEEMESSPTPSDSSLNLEFGESDSDRALSLWAPILLGMMGNQRRRRRLRHMEFEEGENDSDDYENYRRLRDGGMDLEAIVRRRRRSSVAILQLLQSMRAESGTDQDPRENGRDREGVILINPFNQSVVIQGSYDASNDSINGAPIGSLGDYFIGPGLDLLLQHLSENDPNRYGTPPAKKEAVEALTTVRIKEVLQCSVCLDDYEVGDEVKEMPCRHKFHSKCILPWLELHSSCPICRHQLPCDESKLDSEGSRSGASDSTGETDHDAGSHRGDARNERGRQFSVPLPWPLSSLFSSSNSQSSNGNPSTSRQDEN